MTLRLLRSSANLARSLLFTLFIFQIPTSARGAEETSEPQKRVEFVVTYLRDPKRNIFQDKEAQSKLLMPRLRELTADAATRHALYQQRHSDEPVDPADNSLFLNSWDPPTEISVGAAKEEATFATVETTFKWGPETNYPGETRRVVFYLIKNDAGVWQIDDIFHDKSNFSEAENLTTLLSKLWRE